MLGGRGGKASVQTGAMQALGKNEKARKKYKRMKIKRWAQGKPQIKIRDASATIRPDWSTIVVLM